MDQLWVSWDFGLMIDKPIWNLTVLEEYVYVSQRKIIWEKGTPIGN